MHKNLQRVECDPKCGFAIQSGDEPEIIEAVRKHAKKIHNMDTSNKEIKSKMTPA